MILGGELNQGQRVAELDIADTLGVSRTPVRVALGILRAEGLLEGAANRGFTVRRFSQTDVLSSFDVRGALEGLASRTLAERGLTKKTRAELQQCVDIGASLAHLQEVSERDIRRWANANNVFHTTIVEAAELSALSDVYRYLSRLPLASPVAILFKGAHHQQALQVIRQSYHEHAQIFSAIVSHEGARAEALIREHAYRSKQNISLNYGLEDSMMAGKMDDENVDEWLEKRVGKVDVNLL